MFYFLLQLSERMKIVDVLGMRSYKNGELIIKQVATQLSVYSELHSGIISKSTNFYYCNMNVCVNVIFFDIITVLCVFFYSREMRLTVSTLWSQVS